MMKPPVKQVVKKPIGSRGTKAPIIRASPMVAMTSPICSNTLPSRSRTRCFSRLLLFLWGHRLPTTATKQPKAIAPNAVYGYMIGHSFKAVGKGTPPASTGMQTIIVYSSSQIASALRGM